MKKEKLILSAVDCIVFAAALFVSAGISLYLQMTGKKTKEEYLLAGRDMSVLPIAFSHMATFLSTTIFMGVPTEIYLYGTNLVFLKFRFYNWSHHCIVYFLTDLC
ncbi:sodium-coupled monocarboxylate transporter 2 [Trichonephila inaurata madagascariensis]|uniref:Sodium-coupled monocarboxylate transporter 2 n=1 Tax=Trichonephila inaurata madagascariensis TaxID=2747483 RepID=A0A8X6X0F0_9ARAC|nr:sodium-coupled monocarboxylate transporter 2 [Trichonephila inaurata madagascariensis]